jgi:hypothetical protein
MTLLTKGHRDFECILTESSGATCIKAQQEHISRACLLTSIGETCVVYTLQSSYIVAAFLAQSNNRPPLVRSIENECVVNPMEKAFASRALETNSRAGACDLSACSWLHLQNCDAVAEVGHCIHLQVFNHFPIKKPGICTKTWPHSGTLGRSSHNGATVSLDSAKVVGVVCQYPRFL